MPPATNQKRKDALPDEEKYTQQQQQYEKELNALRREFNILDRDQQRAQQHSVAKLSKEAKVFNIFKKEYKNILTNLTVAKSPNRQREDAKMFDEFNSVVMHYTILTNSVEAEKTYLREIEDQIKTVKKSVQSLSGVMITDAQCEERVKAARQTCDLLENKLETQIKKFNLICTRNRKSRKEVDHLLWDRRNFMTMWERLIEKLTAGKKIMLDLIEQATIAYDQREDWCNRLNALRIKSLNELALNTQNMRGLKRKQDHLKKLEEFFNIKGQKRVMQDMILKQKVKRIELKKKLKEKLHTYETMVNEIKDFSEENEIDRIAVNYYNQESNNFSRFRYINDMMEEVEVFNDQLGDVHLEIEESRKLQDERAAQQADTLKTLEMNLITASDQALQAQDDLSTLHLKFENMMEGISRLCKICKCNIDPILQLLGDNTAIKEYNILLYLHVLEKTIHDSLIKAGYRDKIMADKKRTSGKGGEKVISNEKGEMKIVVIEKIVKESPCALCIEHQMVGDLVDTLQHVLSKEEAKRKLSQRLMLPEGTAIVHNISRCTLPKARQLLQKRYE